MKKINIVLRVVLTSFAVSLFIVSLILIDRNFEKLSEHIEAKNQIISELEYKLLNCKLTTINEVKEKQNDEKRSDPVPIRQENPR
jgi:hypothetical protein